MIVGGCTRIIGELGWREEIRMGAILDRH